MVGIYPPNDLDESIPGRAARADQRLPAARLPGALCDQYAFKIVNTQRITLMNTMANW